MRGSTSLWCVVPFTVTLIFAIQHPSDSRKTAGSKTHKSSDYWQSRSLRQSDKNCTLFCERMPQDRRDRNVIHGCAGTGRRDRKSSSIPSGVTGCYNPRFCLETSCRALQASSRSASQLTVAERLLIVFGWKGTGCGY